MPNVGKWKCVIGWAVAAMCLWTGTTFGQDSGESETDERESGLQGVEVEHVRPMMADRGIGEDLQLIVRSAQKAEADEEKKKSLTEYFDATGVGASRFSRSPTTEDIWALQAGFAVGVFPYLESQDPSTFEKNVEWFLEHRGIKENFDGDVAEAYDSYLTSLEGASDEANVDHSGLVNLFETAFRSLSNPDPNRRSHGYLLAGMWASFASIDQLEGLGSTALTDTGDVLVHLFEKDAELAPTDRKFAGHMQTVVDELRKEDPSQKTILTAVGKMKSFVSQQS